MQIENDEYQECIEYQYPPLLTCPGTGMLFKDPVLLEIHGVPGVYERGFIVNWLKKCATEPTATIPTNLNADDIRRLPTAHDVKQNVEEYLRDTLPEQIKRLKAKENQADQFNNMSASEASQNRPATHDQPAPVASQSYDPRLFARTHSTRENLQATFQLPIAVYIFSNAPQNRQYTKGVCLGAPDSNKSKFIDGLTKDGCTTTDQSTIGLDQLTHRGEKHQFKIWNYTDESFLAESKKAYFRKAGFALIFAKFEDLNEQAVANQAIKQAFDIDLDGELFWIKNSGGSVEFVRNVVFENLPHREIRNNGFLSSQILNSRDECHRIALEIVDGAQAMIASMAPNNEIVEPGDKNDSENKKCIVM